MIRRHRALGCASILCSLAAAAPARAVDTYSGQDVQTLARGTTDVMRAHQWLLQAQMERDEVPIFFDGIYRGLRAQLQFQDGSSAPGLLTRAGLDNWGGSGNVKTGFGWFYGVQLDAVLADFDQGSDSHMVADGLTFLGAGYKGFEASAGLRFNWTKGFTANGSFAGGTSVLTRPGTPSAYTADAAATSDRVALTGFTLSTYHVEGVTLGAAVDEALVQASDGTLSRASVLSAARALFQPAPLMRRLDLRDKLGIPGIGIDRLAGQIDYYGDRYVAVRDQLAAARSAASSAPSLIPSSTVPLYEIPVSIDDLLSLGIRLKAVSQVSPTPVFRSAELGWMWSNDVFQAGGRGSVIRRGDAYGGAYDAFVGGGLAGFMLVGSLSYNSPDASTSLPVPFARVVGLQLYFGPPEMARPIVPIVGARKPSTSGSSHDGGS